MSVKTMVGDQLMKALDVIADNDDSVVVKLEISLPGVWFGRSLWSPWQRSGGRGASLGLTGWCQSATV